MLGILEYNSKVLETQNQEPWQHFKGLLLDAFDGVCSYKSTQSRPRAPFLFMSFVSPPPGAGRRVLNMNSKTSLTFSLRRLEVVRNGGESSSKWRSLFSSLASCRPLRMLLEWLSLVLSSTRSNFVPTTTHKQSSSALDKRGTNLELKWRKVHEHLQTYPEVLWLMLYSSLKIFL